MELTPSQITSATFRTVRKGYDPDEVDTFLGRAAKAARGGSTAGDRHGGASGARAAVARLQEVTAATAAAPPDETPAETPAETPVAEPLPMADIEPEGPHEPHLSLDEAETISRTLLLAQHTADTTINEAETEADRIRTEAQVEAEATIDSTRGSRRGCSKRPARRLARRPRPKFAQRRTRFSR